MPAPKFISYAVDIYKINTDISWEAFSILKDMAEPINNFDKGSEIQINGITINSLKQLKDNFPEYINFMNKLGEHVEQFREKVKNNGNYIKYFNYNFTEKDISNLIKPESPLMQSVENILNIFNKAKEKIQNNGIGNSRGQIEIPEELLNELKKYKDNKELYATNVNFSANKLKKEANSFAKIT